MGTKAQPAANDCYEKAEKDEPMFVLLARDPVAPVLVSLWAEINRLNGTQPYEKIMEALECAENMSRYRARLGYNKRKT
jgi:hypothetical protein